MTQASKHPTVHIKHGSSEADVDVEIAPLILLMWHAGIDTCMSCQDFPEGYLWIQFWDSYALMAFLNIIKRQDLAEQFIGARMHYGYNVSWLVGRHQWLYELGVFDLAEDRADDAHPDDENVPDFLAYFNVHIPNSDLPVLIRYMEAYVAGKTGKAVITAAE